MTHYHVDLHAGFVLRDMGEDDLAAVTRIEEACQVTPWSRGVFADCLKAGYDCHVIERDARVAGFQIFSRVLDEAHLLNVAIAPAYQRHGLAWASLRQAFERLKRLDTGIVYLEVRESNAGARMLYQKMGFAITGERKHYYRTQGGRENAILMTLPLRGDHK
ncbi:MAG: ribosomal protein S18-alanine N-acetyltransferase [Alcanivoracaceae bacterium]|jgi:ribosomal-protein-alanine N-acetyltransferase|nr:ribosomal protein S18-alanine N-acetyltransferase [Alcanivoracaceae bacterium]